MKSKNLLIISLLLCGSVIARAQESQSAPTATDSFSQTGVTLQQQLEASLAELTALREQMAAEKIPLSRKLSDLENELIDARREFQQTTRQLDNRTLDLSNMGAEIKSRQDEKSYLSNLLGEYIRNFESTLHIIEIQRYKAALESAKLAAENSNLTDLEVYYAQAALVAASLERLHDALGGTHFDGTAVDRSGMVRNGTFVLTGPTALFHSTDGKATGSAEQRLGSLEPAVIGFNDESLTKAVAATIRDGKGFFPLDPTLGDAHKIEETRESLAEHIGKGGPVMVPILGLAAAALLVAMYKWFRLAQLKSPSKENITALLRAISTTQPQQDLLKTAQEIGGPVGEMLTIGVEHIQEPRELIEEVMFEKVLSVRLSAQSWLPFVAMSASSSPLLGLLGTVTGIINTFKLITVFGSGDVKTLSSGISEALITTEYGLIVAIPSLLLHAFLFRKARGITDEMEKAAVGFINQLSKTPYTKMSDVA